MQSKDRKFVAFNEFKPCFPLTSVEKVIKLFERNLDHELGPNITLLSLVLGVIESKLTDPQCIPAGAATDSSKLDKIPFPAVNWDLVSSLYKTFDTYVKTYIDPLRYSTHPVSRELIRAVSDTVWFKLNPSYNKDRAHIQTLYSYLTEKKLDCFGVAIAVLSAFRQLGLNDVRLVLSEDHSWLEVVDPKSPECLEMEITWHGKGLEDKRGVLVGEGLKSRGWLYLNGKAVRCSREMEVVATVTAINPSITHSLDSQQMVRLQRQLLYTLYSRGAMSNYPMSLGCFGDILELQPTHHGDDIGVTANQLYLKAAEVSRSNYANHHVYPYIYLAGFYLRNRRYKSALYSWALAGGTISLYNYCREEEEIYKEFFEVANDVIPGMLKVVSIASRSDPRSRELLSDAWVYGAILVFYDGVCLWEEDSTTPVVHISWARHLVNTLGKFNAAARLGVTVNPEEDDEDDRRKSSRHSSNQELLQLKDEPSPMFSAVPMISGSDSDAFDGLPVKEAASGVASRSRGCLDDDLGGAILADWLRDVMYGRGGRVYVQLRSAKMKGMKNLLTSERINSNAIELQLTAQSQVSLSRKRGFGPSASSVTSDGKRKRY